MRTSEKDRLTADKERLKALMDQHTERAGIVTPVATVTPARPLPAAIRLTPTESRRRGEVEAPKPFWTKISVCFTAAEAQKINDAIIATQQVNRMAKVTTADILRVALRRLRENEAITPSELRAVSAREARKEKSPAG